MTSPTQLTAPLAAGYLLDPGWHAERDRLNSLTQLYDATTLSICARLGVSTGWRCADVGAGTGSVAEALAAGVGPTGLVVATDLDTRFLEPLAAPNLQVRRHDVTTEALPAASFDLVHTRLLLEHLPERDTVLAELAAAVAPGGWLVVEDFDWATAAMVDPPSPVHDRVVAACLALFGTAAYRPTYGRALPRRLSALGLTDVQTHAQAMQVRADRAHGLPAWELLVDQLSPGLLAHGLITQDDLDAFHELWHDDDSICFSPLMVSCWGRRPS
jgi:ubiquinone/menaquinone biosynthesis C-methylase UbiE